MARSYAHTGSFYIRLVEAEDVIAKKILQEMARKLDKAIRLAIPNIKPHASNVILENMLDNDVMNAINGGNLMGTLGLTAAHGMNASIEIAHMVAGSLEITGKKVRLKGAGLQGGLTIHVQPSNFANVLGISEGVVEYFSKRYEAMIKLDWLNWLLTRGDDIIVGDYSFIQKPGIGRSGLGAMTAGGVFRIPPEYSGTQDDNFITRTLLSEAVTDQLTQVLEQHILSKL